jgi:hypothetical protein
MSRISGTRTPTQSQQGISLAQFEPQNDLSSRESVTKPSELAAHTAGRWTPPFMPWFEQDFQGSLRVRRLPREARSIYRELLCAGWHCDNAPYLPNDPEELRAICDCPPRLWKKYGQAVMECFTPTSDANLLYHPKMVREYERALSEHQRKVAAGRSRWNKPMTEGSGPQIQTHEHYEYHLHQEVVQSEGAGSDDSTLAKKRQP